MVSTQAQTSPIWTPDRRLRVFVSSTLGELAEERAAVRSAIEQLRLSPVMFELGARPHPPRALYRSYVEQSDVFLGIYWQRYGWVAPDMAISGLEDEFELSRGMPRLMYVKRPAPDMEPQLSTMLRRLQAGDSTSYKPFGSAEELRGLVLDDLALLLTERFGAATTGHGGSAVTMPTVPRPATRLVGREAELDEVEGLFASDHRLVTLTGVGGVGKTRLALAVLDRARRRGVEQVAFVDLSATTQPEEVLPRLVIATGAREEGREQALDALVRRIADRPWLLVLDNFEQVVMAAPLIASLLEGCAGLQLLVTSRVLLRLRGEREYAVRPLPVEGRAAPALELFEERARAVRADFAVDEDNRPVVVELCRRLDGLPLALELAASQLRLFAPSQLLARLADWLEGQALLPAYADLPERQRTLRATVDWSWGLLDEDARRLFARLAVFSGSFTVADATEVCGLDGVEVLAPLGALLDHSLVSPDTRPDGTPAFRMLDTIRARARTRLAESGEQDVVFAALERHLLVTFAAAAGRLHTTEQAQVVRHLDGYLGDLSATLSWQLERRGPLAPLLEAVASCWVWGQIRGHLRRLPDFARQLAGADPREAAIAAWLHMGQLITGCRYAEVAAFIREKLALLRLLDPPAHGMALVVLGLSTSTDVAAASTSGRRILEEAVEFLRGTGYLPGVGYGLSHLGDARLVAGDLDAARAAYDEALQLGGDLGDVNLTAEAGYHLATVELELGRPEEARRLLRTAARYYVELDHQDGISRCLALAAGLEVAEGRPHRAAELFGTVDGVRDPLELAPWPMVGLVEQRWRQRVADLVDAGESAAAEARGRPRGGVSELVAALRL